MFPGKDSPVLGTRGGERWEGLGSHPLCSPVSGLLVERRLRVHPTDWEQPRAGRECSRPGHRPSGLSSARVGHRLPRGPQPVASPRLLPGFGHVSPVSARPQLPTPPRCPKSFNLPWAAASLAHWSSTPCAWCSWIPSLPAGAVAVGPCPQLTLCHLPPSSCRAGAGEAARGVPVLAGPSSARTNPERRRISLGNAGGFGTAPAPSCRWCWRPGAGEKLWSCSPRGSTASGMCGQGTNSHLGCSWLAVGCGDCQLCFLEGRRTPSSQAWPVLDRLLRRREEPPAGSSPSQDFHPCPSCCIPGVGAIPGAAAMPSAKEKLRRMRGALSTEDFQNQGITVLPELRQLLPLVWDRCLCPCHSGAGGGFSCHACADVPCPHRAATQRLRA